MARRLTLLVPGALDTRTGGYEYDRRMAAGLREVGWQVEVIGLDASYPHPTPAARAATAAILASLPANALVMVDGLAFGAMPEEAGREASRLRLVALVHHPLARETGISAEAAAALEISERRALTFVRHVIVTGHATVNALAPYGVSPERITVIEPGTDQAPLARGSGGRFVELLAVGSIVPRKGFEVLIDALSRIQDRPWRLTCAGSLERAPATVSRVRALVSARALDDRVAFTGELGAESLAAAYDRADLFVLPTFYEGYGMVVAEALARGLPIVSTPAGGIPDLVTDDSGILVPVADAAALAEVIARIIDDAALRDRLRAGAAHRRLTLPGWGDRAAQLAGALTTVLGAGLTERGQA
jgi:glycosyltransferase involved in cell wall biosynthesis